MRDARSFAGEPFGAWLQYDNGISIHWEPCDMGGVVGKGEHPGVGICRVYFVRLRWGIERKVHVRTLGGWNVAR